jgi:hypothetical protein
MDITMSIIAKKDYPDGYPNDALDILRAMSFTNGKNVHVVGSMSLRSQIYAGDYDAIEVVETHGNRDLDVKSLVRKFKGIIRTLRLIPYTYIADVKAGTIDEWVIIHEPYDHKRSLLQLEKLHKEHIISKKMYVDGIMRIKPNVSKLELMKLQRDFRPNVVRWKPSEIIVGSKTLQDGRRFTLEEAFQTPIIAKLDVISWVQNNRFTDFSVIYQFKSNGKVLNPGFGDIEDSIRENIFMLYHEKNYFKMAKRMFALAKHKKNMDILTALSPLFNGDVGRLYMVYGDIGTLEGLLDLNESVSNSKIDFEIDQFKGRLSNISLEDYVDVEHQIFRLIDRLVTMRSNSREHIKELLGKIKTILGDLMSEYSEHYLKSVKLFPKY